MTQYAYMTQAEFNLMIGELDNIISKMVLQGKRLQWATKDVGDRSTPDMANIQTLKHHAEDI